MALTDEQKEKIVKHLDKKWIKRACHICGEDNWNISDSIFEMKEFIEKNQIIVHCCFLR